MSHMDRNISDRLRGPRLHRVDPTKKGGVDKNDPYELNFTPLLLPGLVSVPKLPAWLQKLGLRLRNL
jgi:hypothetical protein